MSAWYGMLSAMRITLAGVSAFFLMVGLAEAQTKPVCLFDPGPHPPSFAQCGTIPDWASDADMARAKALSEQRGLKWILQLGYNHPLDVPIGAHATAIREKFAAAGLLPHLVAMSVNEEIYEHWLAGSFTGPYQFPPTTPNGIEIIRVWMGYQHAQAKAALGLPVIWITTVAGHPAGTFRPIPPNVDFVALDAYIPEGGTFDLHVAPIFAYAEQSVAGTSMRLVQIPPWFEAEGWETPTDLDLRKYAAWVARPLWAATIGFTWRDRPYIGMRGLESLTSVRASVERTLKGAQ